MIRKLHQPSLRQTHAPVPRTARPGAPVTFGATQLDSALGGGLARGALHEIHAGSVADLAAATGFALALARRAMGELPMLWARQDVVEQQTGGLHAPGLVEIGLDPGRVVLVRARDAPGLLRAAEQAAGSTALGAALIEPWGEPRQLDLTASRRLSLAAQASGVFALLLRVVARPLPSAAWTRWRVCSAPSAALVANAPGHPTWNLALLRHREGIAAQAWCVEWNRDQRCFEHRESHGAALSGAVVPVPADRSAAPAARLRGIG